MTTISLPLLETGELLRNSPYDGLSDVFSRYDNGLVLVVHEMIAGLYESERRYLQLGVIASQSQSVTFSDDSVYLPTTRFVWSLDNQDIKYESGGIILPINVGQPCAFLKVPMGTDYSRTLFIGTKEVEVWLASEKNFPCLQQDLCAKLGYRLPHDGESFDLNLQFA